MEHYLTLTREIKYLSLIHILFEYRCETEYDIDDIILTEYGTTVVGLEMMRSVNEESAEEARKIAIEMCIRDRCRSLTGGRMYVRKYRENR